MRSEDLRDYYKLRRIAENPWATIRFRKRQRAGGVHVVRMRRGPPLHLRAHYTDFHMFHRIFLRDDYRLGALSDAELGTVVDLGANIGLFAACVAPRARRVVSCEPSSDSIPRFELNAGPWAHVSLDPVAVAGRSGPLRLYRPRHAQMSGTHSAFPDPEGQRHVEAHEVVQAVTIAELLTNHQLDHVDLLKLDVEGQEYEILYTAGDRLQRVRRIHGEYHDVAPDDPATRIDALAAFLRAQGFRIEIRPHRRKPNHGLFFATRMH